MSYRQISTSQALQLSKYKQDLNASTGIRKPNTSATNGSGVGMFSRVKTSETQSTFEQSRTSSANPPSKSTAGKQQLENVIRKVTAKHIEPVRRRFNNGVSATVANTLNSST